MHKLKVAILEDNKEQLKERKLNLEETGLVKVIFWASSSEEFFEKLKNETPEALILDIDLGNDSMSGIEVAYKMKLPVLFVSSHNAKNLKEIETLKRDCDLEVEHITKPFTDEAFKKTATRFINDVIQINQSAFVYLDFADSKRNKIPVDTIVYLCADKAKGSASNNKEIFFTNRKPEVLIDFSFNKMEEKGFSKKQFITIHRSYVVNAKHMKSQKKVTHEIEVEAQNYQGKPQLMLLKAAENFKM